MVQGRKHAQKFNKRCVRYANLFLQYCILTLILSQHFTSTCGAYYTDDILKTLCKEQRAKKYATPLGPKEIDGLHVLPGTTYKLLTDHLITGDPSGLSLPRKSGFKSYIQALVAFVGRYI